MNEKEENEARERIRRIAAEFARRGDALGWFEAVYSQAAGDNEQIPWADLEPNKFLRRRAEQINLRGDGRKALVVGCGLGDDARFLYDAGFDVTAFDISPTAIEWARRIHADTRIKFFVADLFNPPTDWSQAFEFVLEVYTIQPLPLEMRESVIDAIAGFVAPRGRLLVVTRGRETDETPTELPWALSKKDLSRFEAAGLKQTSFTEMQGDEPEPIRRFVVEYEKD